MRVRLKCFALKAGIPLPWGSSQLKGRAFLGTQDDSPQCAWHVSFCGNRPAWDLAGVQFPGIRSRIWMKCEKRKKRYRRQEQKFFLPDCRLSAAQLATANAKLRQRWTLSGSLPKYHNTWLGPCGITFHYSLFKFSTGEKVHWQPQVYNLVRN